jgi:hypothetical protein
MFVLTTLVAVVCYVLVLPTVNAKRFIRAIDAGDFPAADALFIDPSDAFLADWREESSEFRATAELLPWSIRQIIAAERTVSLNILKMEVNGPSRGRLIRIIAHRTGLGKPPVYGGSFGGGGIAAS